MALPRTKYAISECVGAERAGELRGREQQHCQTLAHDSAFKYFMSRIDRLLSVSGRTDSLKIVFVCQDGESRTLREKRETESC